ncbi:uncharacterized protein LOC128724978 [Anopheles nili]|uniref:uncharacterized protein LOC128724978 n=1 Tax=Anopheles nili TaxID=185578 RepID=UPI00237BAAD0|nr:uncharacterized protein LOC128724978 [Anopheles nili]
MAERTNPCRVCLGQGARNMFHCSPVDEEKCSAASISYLPEKLQFVTLLQVSESDGLSNWICELCIIQLNVAFQFKLLATESDTKLRQQVDNASAKVPVEGSSIMPEFNIESTIEIMPPVKMEFVDVGSYIPCSPAQAIADQSSDPSSSRTAMNSCNSPSTMVCLQKDLIDPERDAAFIKSIIKQSEVDVSSPADDGKNTTTVGAGTPNDPKTKTVPKESASSVPTSSKQQSKDKPRRKRSRVSSRKDSRKRPLEQSSKTCESKNTVQNKRQRVMKLLEKLRIDMVCDFNVDKSKLDIPSPTRLISLNIPKKIITRRNSICVS